MKLAYRPEIDGLRTLAVVPVILYHADFADFRGGFVGVDIFFVISGYLIGSIILAELAAGRFSFAAFYERRARRILPALLGVIIATLIAMPLVAMPQELTNAAESALFAVVGLSNFYFWGESGYFAPAVELMPLLHTWSLGVEEQFYVFLPPALILLAWLKLDLRKTFVFVLPLLFAASVWASHNSAAAAFYLLPARAWELGVGVALAAGVVPRIANQKANEAVAWVGIAAIIFAVFWIDTGMVFPGWVALIPCLGTAAVIAAASQDNWAGRFLSLAPMRTIGLWSYSLYLWHWPIFVFLRHLNATQELELGSAILGIVLTFIFSVLTYRFVEQPFRAKKTMPIGGVAKRLTAATGVVVAVAVSIVLSNGFPDRVSEDTARVLAASADTDPLQEQCNGLGRMDLTGKSCRIGDPTLPASFILVGDSHSAALRPALEKWALDNNVSGILTWRGACPLLIGAHRVPGEDAEDCARFKEEFVSRLKDTPGIRRVILAGRWTAAFSGTRPESGGSYRTYLVDEISRDMTPTNSERVFNDAIKRSVDELRQLGMEVTILGSVPEFGFDVPKVLALSSHNGVQMENALELPDSQRELLTALDGLFAEIADARTGVRYVPLHPLFCTPMCSLVHEGRPIYFDDDHVTATTARELVGPYIIEQMQSPGPTSATGP